MRVVGALKKRCRFCTIVRKKKHTYIYCVANPRHKQRAIRGFSTMPMPAPIPTQACCPTSGCEHVPITDLVPQLYFEKPFVSYLFLL